MGAFQNVLTILIILFSRSKIIFSSAVN